MINREDYKQFLLSSIPTAAPASGGEMVACRCFYCPDGKSRNSKHFYISLPDEDKPSLYYCHKCHSSGVVTYKTLIEWNIYNETIAMDLISHNKIVSKYKGNNKYFDRSIYRINNTKITDSNTSRIKLKYINDRLGLNYTYSDLMRMKICLNLKDLLAENMISNYTRDPSVISQLDANFVGFISLDNAFLNMRRLCDEGLVYKSIDKRYINYSIFNKFDTSERFYTIPVSIDLKQVVNIHIAEGPFDILSIYENLRHREPGFYTAVGGSNYIGQIIHFVEAFEIPLFNFHIYPDNDKSGADWKMNKIAEFLKPLRCELYIHRNMYPGEKDFGVRPERIKESIVKKL